MVYENHQSGRAAEQAACLYLRQHKLKLIRTNYACRFGEIDLIMKDQNEFVFVEVRLRNNQNHHSGLESITDRKQQKLQKTAQFYLQTHHLLDKVLCRFDVVAVVKQNTVFHCDWIQNAF